MAVVEIEERLMEELRAQATARDMSLEAFLHRIAATAVPLNSVSRLGLEDFEHELDRLSSDSPVLPPSFSRADFYADHD